MITKSNRNESKQVYTETFGLLQDYVSTAYSWHDLLLSRL